MPIAKLTSDDLRESTRENTQLEKVNELVDAVNAGAGGGGIVGPGTTNTVPMFTSAVEVGDSPLVVDLLSAATSIVHTEDNLSVGVLGTPDVGGGNPDGAPFFVSPAGHCQVNKVDITSTGSGALEVWGGAKINDNLLFGNRNDADQTVLVNQGGFESAFTRWRSLHVYDGKNAPIVEFDASSKVSTFRGVISEPNSQTARDTDLQMVGLVSNGTFNCTGAAVGCFGVVAQLSGTRSSGANALTNTGFYADVSGGHRTTR